MATPFLIMKKVFLICLFVAVIVSVTALPSFADEPDIVNFAFEPSSVATRKYGFIISTDGVNYTFYYMNMDLALNVPPEDITIYPFISDDFYSSKHHYHICIGYHLNNQNLNTFDTVFTVSGFYTVDSTSSTSARGVGGAQDCKGLYGKDYFCYDFGTLYDSNNELVQSLSDLYIVPVDGLYSGNPEACMKILENYPVNLYRYNNDTVRYGFSLIAISPSFFYYRFEDGLTNYVDPSPVGLHIIADGLIIPTIDPETGEVTQQSINIDLDMSPILDYRPDGLDVPFLEFDYSSDMPDVYFNQTQLSTLQVMDGGSALTWFYARINDLGAGNVKILALITSCLSLGFVTLILNKRV